MKPPTSSTTTWTNRYDFPEVIAVEYAELVKSLADPSLGLHYTCAEQVFNAVTHADVDKLLDELECAQYLELGEIEDLFGFQLGESPITARDVVFAMRTLVYLHQIHVSVTPRLTPSWDEIKRAFPVGSVHTGSFTRKIKGGYLIRLSASEISTYAFLPNSGSITSCDDASAACFRIAKLDENRLRIIVAFEA